MAKGENIFKRKDGRWEARYAKIRDENGKIKYGFCYGKTYAEAKAKVEEAKAQVSCIGISESVGKTKRFAFYCDRWLDLHKMKLKMSSYVKYQSGMENHIKPYLGELYLKDITTEKISEFSQYLLKEKNLSIKSVRDILAFVHSILSYINRQVGGMLSHVEVIYPREFQKAIRILDEQEEATLVSHLAEETHMLTSTSVG